MGGRVEIKRGVPKPAKSRNPRSGCRWRAGQNILVDLRVSELLDTAAKLFDRAFLNPVAIAEEGAKLAQELQKVAYENSTWAPPRHDKRFNDSAWTENTFYKSLLQGYMAWSQSLQNFAEKGGLETKEAARAKFLLLQISEALAPTNFLFSNPAAIKAAIDSGGKTLLDGYQNFLEDAVEGRPIPSQVDFGSFRVGDNLAMTPGDVVMRHEMFELIQYAPQTEQVWHRPILFIPSIINKYYAFDLAPGRSLFEFLVKSGFTLFSMVFRNPKAEHDHWGMEDYMEAMDAAFNAVQEISGVEDPHTIALCGAAPLAVGLAGYYAAQGRRNIGSMTLNANDQIRIADERRFAPEAALWIAHREAWNKDRSIQRLHSRRPPRPLPVDRRFRHLAVFHRNLLQAIDEPPAGGARR